MVSGNDEIPVCVRGYVRGYMCVCVGLGGQCVCVCEREREIVAGIESLQPFHAAFCVW